MTDSLAIGTLDAPAHSTADTRMPWGVLGLLLIIVAYALLLATRYAPAISEPDDNGYFAQGTLLAQTGRTWFVPESDAQYIGMHWLITPKGHYISRYPPGLAVLIGAVYLVGGYKAALLVNPALSVLALVGLYMLSRRLVSVGWSLCAVLVMAANPVFVHHALAGDSHMAVTFCVIWGLFLLLRWSQEGQLWQVFLAGLVLGCIPTIRYPDAIMALGFGAFLLWHWNRFEHIGRHYAAALMGAAIPILPLLIRNQLVLGAFWRTGYSLTNEQTGFSWEYFREHALNYVTILHSGGAGLMFALGVIGISCMICTRPLRPLGVMMTLLAVPMLLLYMAYYWGPAMGAAMTMRFILPTFVVYILAGVWALSQMLAHAPAAARVVVPTVLVCVQLLWGASSLLQESDRLHYQKQTLAIATDALDKFAAAGDVVIGNNQVLQQLDFVRKWKVADASAVTGRGAMGGPGGGPGGGPDGGRRFAAGGFGPGGGDPDAPSPMQQQKRELQREKYTGSADQRFNKFADDVYAWAGTGHKVWFIGPESELTTTLGREGMKIVSRVSLPEAPQMEGPGGGGFGGGGGRGGRGFAGPGGGFAGPGGFGGPGGGFGGRGGGGGPGGPGGMMRGFAGEKEIVIAEWIGLNPGARQGAGTAPTASR